MANVPALGRFDQRSVPRVVRNTCAEEARSSIDFDSSRAAELCNRQAIKTRD